MIRTLKFIKDKLAPRLAEIATPVVSAFSAEAAGGSRTWPSLLARFIRTRRNMINVNQDRAGSYTILVVCPAVLEPM